jgi:hypothetical protein
MPQPITNVPDLGLIYFSNTGDRPFLRIPRLGVFVGETIAAASNVDSFMLSLFIELMGGPADKAAAIYMALDTRGPKRAALKAVAEHTLTDERKNLLTVIMDLTKSLLKKRDKIAHGIWGYANNRTDLLLWADFRDFVLSPDSVPKEKIYAYFESDFASTIEEADLICGYAQKLRFIFMDHIDNENNRLYHELSNEHSIRERLDRLASPT